MIIPHRMLSPDTLRGVIEAFVTREGTDYGVQEVPLDIKVYQVQQQLDLDVHFVNPSSVFLLDKGSHWRAC